MTGIVDSHCHLQNFRPAEIDEIIKSVRRKGIVKIITSSTSPEDWHFTKGLSKKYREVEYTLGLHPWFARSWKPDKIKLLLDANYSSNVIGIGEIGLDRFRKDISSPNQIDIFRSQLEFACEKNLPVVLHCVRAYNELIEILKNTGVPHCGGIIHDFSSGPQIAETLLDLNISISAGGYYADTPSAKAIEALKSAWPENLLLETDSPDSRSRHGGMIKSPADTEYILDKISALLDTAPETVAEWTTANAARIFRLDI